MKISKNKKYKYILLLVCVIIIAGEAAALKIIINYNNQPYVKAEKIIKMTSEKGGIPLSDTEDKAVKIYKSNQQRIESYDWLYKLEEITFGNTTAMYCIVNGESIGDFIRSEEYEENGKTEIFELYEVKDISNEYMIAVKVPNEEEYIGVTTLAYNPDNLQMLAEDLQLNSSYVEIEFVGDEQNVWYQNVDAEYICSKFFTENNKYIYRSVSYQRYNGMDRETLDLWITFYQQSINQSISMVVYEDGNIRFFLGNARDYEFEADMEDTLELLNYITDNYTGCVYRNREN